MYTLTHKGSFTNLYTLKMSLKEVFTTTIINSMLKICIMNEVSNNDKILVCKSSMFIEHCYIFYLFNNVFGYHDWKFVRREKREKYIYQKIKYNLIIKIKKNKSSLLSL